MIPYVKPVMVAVAVTALVSGGWSARGWYEGSQDLVAMKARNALADSIRDDIGEVSRNMEQQLKDFSPGQTVIDRGVVREIQTQVFRNVCIPPSSQSFRMLNRIAAGESAGEPSSQSAQDATETN